MRSTSYTALRKNLAKTMDEVCHSHAPVMITRSNNDPVIMISLEDYEALNETSYLLRSPANAKRLSTSIDQLESGKGTNRKLSE